MKIGHKIYETKQDQRRDFWIGFFGSLTVNVVVATILSPVIGLVAAMVYPGDETTLVQTVSFGMGGAMLLANLAVLLFLLMLRKWMAYGVLAAFAFALAAGLALSVFFVTACSIFSGT